MKILKSHETQAKSEAVIVKFPYSEKDKWILSGNSRLVRLDLSLDKTTKQLIQNYNGKNKIRG